MEWNTLKCKDGIAISRGAIEAVAKKTATRRNSCIGPATFYVYPKLTSMYPKTESGGFTSIIHKRAEDRSLDLGNV